MNDILAIEKRKARNQRRRELYAQKKIRNEGCSDTFRRRSRRIVTNYEHVSLNTFNVSNEEIEMQHRNKEQISSNVCNVSNEETGMQRKNKEQISSDVCNVTNEETGMQRKNKVLAKHPRRT